MRDRDSLDTFTDVCFIAMIITVIVLKCAGIITLSWFWLLSPLWGAFVIGIGFCIIVTIIHLVHRVINSIKEKKDED